MMEHFFLPNGGVSMNDVLTTLGAVIAGLVAWRQKEKDAQIRNRDEVIRDLRDEMKIVKAELAHCYEKRAELADRKLD